MIWGLKSPTKNEPGQGVGVIVSTQGRAGFPVYNPGLPLDIFIMEPFTKVEVPFLISICLRNDLLEGNENRILQIAVQ